MSQIEIKSPSADKWKDLAAKVLDYAKQQGSDQASVSLELNWGYDVSVRERALEQLNYHDSRAAGIIVYKNQAMGHVSITDCRLQALHEAVDKALAIAERLKPDECNGLADVPQLAFNYPDLSLYHPWDLDVQAAVSKALACEEYALSLDDRLHLTESCSINSVSSLDIYANSEGFSGYYPSSQHSMTLVMLAQDEQGMQVDYDYTADCDATKLMSIEDLASSAVKWTVDRLGAQTVKTGNYPIIFHSRVARTLLRHFLSAISGSQLYREQSFLRDQLGEVVFPDFVQIDQSPHLMAAPGSLPFDAEGVATADRPIITDGVLQTYLMGSYSARRLGMQSTGNASGAQNVRLSPQEHSLKALCKQMGTGLLITDMMGQGVNLLTGNYSRGAFGYWVENGEIQYPVQELTLAGNLKNMFGGIVALGNDLDQRGRIICPSMLIDSMSVAGT